MSSLLLEEPVGRNGARSPVKLWPVVTFPISALAVWAVNAGGEALRWLGLGAVAWSLALPLLISLEAGLFAMMLFEPLRGFLRRAQYLFLPYSATDPIHVVTPLVTLMAFGMLLQRRKLRIFRETPLAWLVTILSVIYFLEIFNPLQGSITVGLSGAMFMLVPVAWFYFGQDLKPAFLETALRLMVVLGILTSFYGLYQLAFGFPAFEQYWLDHTEFYDSISVGNVKRALATYSSAEEWGRYIEIGAIIAFGFATCAGPFFRRVGWFVSGVALTAMLLLTGQRTAMFGLILGCLLLMVLGARSWRSVVGRISLALAPMLLVAFLVQAPTNDDMLSHGEEERMGAVLSHTTRGTLNPTSEDSLQERLKNWTYLFTELVPYRPLGIGLGGTSLAAYRFSDDVDLPPIDSYFISTVITCGLPTALLFIWILMRATAMSWRAFRRSEVGSREARVWRITTTLLPVLILNSFFGNTFTLYSVAPVGWLIIGWISAGTLRQVQEESVDESPDSLAFGSLPAERAA
ncbi:MAG TPA: O-antigen ligase family protein [Pyrinomonadaceae bacterium]|nr:O-antigen ligase family protein [Pyrinomonadaceae bacterium]